MSTRRRIPTRIASLLTALALLAVACSGSATTTISEVASDNNDAGQDTTVQEPEPTAVPPTAEPDPTPAPEPTATPEPEPTATPEPVVYWGSELEPGMCINRLEGNPPFQPPDIISCDDFHEEEIFAAGMLDFPPGAPFPGDDEVADLVDSELCAQATVDFAGEPWDLIPVGTFLLYPGEEEWDAGDRHIFCSATAVEGVAFKIGTAAGGTIDSDDVLIARSGFVSDGEEFEDWIVLTEHGNIDTVGTLTDGQLDLQLRRPFALADGFVFNARTLDDDTHPNSTYGVSWTDGTLRDLGIILSDAEQASTMLSSSGRAVFAARAEDGDWDLFTNFDGTASPLAAGPGDQHYATFTPDFSQVVYHDDGDLWVIDADGNNARQLTSGPDNDWESIVSPDGSTVVFASDRSGNDDLWSVPIDGSSEPVNLTNHPGDDIWPIFSADGSLIYFSSDRLDPVDDRSTVMVMNADGSNQSWFAAVSSAQAILVPEQFGDQMVDFAPTLDERYNYDLVAGEPGEVTTFTHSSGRLQAELPAGWRVGEVNEQVGFLTAPRPNRYFETWNTDGVLVLLYDDLTRDEFFALYDETDAAQSCEQFDGSAEITAVDEKIDFFSGNFNCGDDGAVGGILAFYNNETGVGLLMEGQRDNFPDADSDSELITAIARSVLWQ